MARATQTIASLLAMASWPAVRALQPDGLRRCQAAATDVTLTTVNYQTFADCQDSVFQLSDLAQGARYFEVQLKKIERLKPSGSLAAAAETASERRFSLRFLGPASPRVEQGIYRFQHSSLGELDLFIVPIWKDERGVWYEAVFNSD